MEERIPLAKQLRAMKEADIADKGAELTRKILELVKMRYSKSEIAITSNQLYISWWGE